MEIPVNGQKTSCILTLGNAILCKSRTSAFKWVRRNEMKETERAALGNKAKKCPVDTFLARGRVPPKQMAVQRTVSCFGEMVRVDDIGLDY